MSKSDVNEDYLEVDSPVPGQNYVCVSFVSPESVIKDKQVFMFNQYMRQQCAEFEKEIEGIMEKASDELKNKIRNNLVNSLHYHLKYKYNDFKDKFDDFTYKYNDELNTEFEKISEYKTSVRGVKVRGVYSTYPEAEKRAKYLQRTDRSFHVFVGQVGYWLPWDPCADHVQNEEYLEEELNTLMKEYKENEVRKDMFYEEQKREKTKAAMEERLRAEKEKKEAEEKSETALEEAKTTLQEEDPWMKAKFSETNEATENTNQEETI